jgi:flagellar protein FliL
MSDASAAAPEAAAKDKEKPAAAAKGGKNTLLIIIAAAVLALGAGGGGAWFFMHKSAADEEATADSGDEGEHDAKEEKSEKSKDNKGKKNKKGKAAEPKLPALYIKYEPPFVVNFDAKGVMRFLQVSMEAMTRDAHTEELIKQNEPKIRNNMLLLLGSQTYDTISTMEGKEELRKKAREIIAKVVDEEGGEAKKVEDIYFTSFVMQ